MASRVAKKRREERRNAPTVPQPRPASTPSNRGTFRVAQALRVLASELPDVVQNSTRGRKDQGVAQRSPSPAALAQIAVPRSAATKKTAPDTRGATPRQIGLNEPLPKCKKRPDGNKPRKAGAGAGKDFVPWC